MPYQEGFQLLVDIGLLDVILPFILIFTITFATLQNTKVFGVEGKKKAPKTKLNAMVAFVMGFFAVLATNLLNIINIVLFYFVLLLVIVLLLALIFGLSGGEVKSKLFIGITLLFAFLFLFYALVRAGFIEESAFWTGFVIPMVILAVIVYGIHYLFRGKKPKAPARPRGAPERQPQRPPGEGGAPERQPQIPPGEEES